MAQNEVFPNLIAFLHRDFSAKLQDQIAGPSKPVLFQVAMRDDRQEGLRDIRNQLFLRPLRLDREQLLEPFLRIQRQQVRVNEAETLRSPNRFVNRHSLQAGGVNGNIEIVIYRGAKSLPLPEGRWREIAFCRSSSDSHSVGSILIHNEKEYSLGTGMQIARVRR